MRRLGILVFAFVPTFGVIAACTSLPGDCDYTKRGCPGVEGDGSVDGLSPDGSDAVASDGAQDAGRDSDAPGCDASKSPKDEPCLLDDKYAVFVNQAGSDATGDGTKAKPKATIGAALTTAKAGGKEHVIICDGTFAENLIVDGAKSGLKVHGRFRCNDWVYDNSKKTTIKPAAGLPLKIDTVTSFLGEDLDVEAPNATVAGASSIGIFVGLSQAVILRRVAVKAGDGMKGDDGAGTSNYNPALQSDDPLLAGSNASGTAGGVEKDCVSLCTNNMRSTGGAGGRGGASPTDGGKGLPDRGAGAGGTVLECTTGQGGKGGNPAPSASGGAGAPTPGTLIATGWTPASGSPGVTGGPGQGGGGGGGKVSGSNGGGGGGGCGGCGGGQGAEGRGGGSSFAVLSFQSGVTLDACDLRAAAAKEGGKGADGQVGQIGGLSGTPTTGGCSGGDGGRGGGGGGGGGGAGGLSVAIAYKGTPPAETNGTTKQVGAPGNGGQPGTGGSPTATKGLDGEAAVTKALP